MTGAKKLITIGLGSALLFSCGNGKDHENAHDGVDSSAVHQKDTVAVTVDDTSKFKFDYTLANIPSPAMAIQVLKSYNVAYDRGMLSDYVRVPGYASEFQHSINLGVLTIDMAYAMSNNIGVDVLEYTKASLILVDRMGMSAALNQMVGKRAEMNMSNRDSIFALVDEILIKSDSYLRTNKRLQTATNIFTGSWIEAIYLNGALYSHITTPELKEKARKQLWDQRLYLSNLLMVLKDFNKEEQMRNLIKDLTEIHEMIVKVKQPVDMTEAKFKEIYEKIDLLRNRMIG